jgi:uncharacterized protein YgiM (DUF1202 family)
MQKSIFKVAVGVAVGTFLVLGEAHAESASPNDGFREIRVAPGIATADNLIDVILPFLRNHPESEEGNAGMQLNVQKDGADYNVDILLTGYLDDNVSGEHYRGHVIRTSDGKWELLAMAAKPICARGVNVNGVCTSASPPPAMFLTPGTAHREASKGSSMCVNVSRDDVLNVRAGPGTRFQTLGALAAGNCDVELSDTCEGNWCQIQAASLSGWVNTRYLIPAN